ncbi:MAG: hypothetical protein MZW92_11310 [Comamonadaceae bacterium]|nr:hypothetical protein [Comamonadaceae bacterium]
MIYQICQQRSAAAVRSCAPDIPPASTRSSRAPCRRIWSSATQTGRSSPTTWRRPSATASSVARAEDFADSEKFETLRALPFFREFSDVEIWEVVRFSQLAQVVARHRDHAGRRAGRLLLLPRRRASCSVEQARHACSTPWWRATASARWR